MTTLHLKRRLHWRFSTLGLFLSFGLIFGASGIILLNAAEYEGAPAEFEEACEGVPSKGHPGVERRL